MHMATNDVVREWMWDILREFPGHNFALGLRTLKHKSLKNEKAKKTLKNLKT